MCEDVNASAATDGSTVFVAFDWCGWNDQYGRFTAMPDGATLTCKAWMGQADWDAAQLDWFQQFSPDIVVHRCETGPYRDTMGTVGEIVKRLKSRCCAVIG